MMTPVPVQTSFLIEANPTALTMNLMNMMTIRGKVTMKYIFTRRISKSL